MEKFNCGFIGIGLIGGSIARALKENFCNKINIIAYDINEKSIKYALEENIIDQECSSINENFSNCKIIFLCGPIQDNINNLHLIKEYISNDCIVTDIGSVKADIHQAVKELNLENVFIGGHPMTGSERQGILNSKSLLLENAYYILTHSSAISEDKIQFIKQLLAKIKSIPIVMTYDEHDYVTAAISHLPHIIAFSLVQLVKENDTNDEYMKTIAAGGFKDITRIASSSPDLWKQICSSNSENIIKLLELYINKLNSIKSMLENNEIYELGVIFKDAQEYRESFIDNCKGSILKSYSIFIDIADETGELARITNYLASSNINIKNIEIAHNREYQEGTLKIEFPTKDDLILAKNLLIENKYKVYERK